MKTTLICHTVLASLLGVGVLSACDSGSDPQDGADTEAADTEAADTEDEHDTDHHHDTDHQHDTDVDDSDTDVDPPDTDGGSDTDVDPPDTDGESDTDVDTTSGAKDCTCYDPAANDALGIEDSCLTLVEALPGCAFEKPSCEAIVLEEGDEEQVSNVEAVECVVQAFAAGEQINFDVRFESPLGGDTTNYRLLSNGGYAARNCGFYDNPPEYQSLALLDSAGVDHFSACLAAHTQTPSADGLYACLLDGLPEYEGDGAFPACE